MLDVRTTACLTREQGVQAQRAVISLVSTCTMQARFDQLELQAAGKAEAYAVLLSSSLRKEVYPQVCEHLGFPKEQVREATDLIIKSFEALVIHVNDLEMRENWLEMETLMRNTKHISVAQFFVEASKNVAARFSESRSMEGEYDIDYATVGAAAEFGRAIADRLADKGFCMVQMSESEQTRKQAAHRVSTDGIDIEESFAQEFESAYLGSNNVTQVKAIQPLDDGQGPLNMLSQQAISALNAVGSYTKEYFGHYCWATTSLLARVSDESSDVIDPPQLKDCGEFGSVQAYERFIRGRTICVLYMVDNAGGIIHLRPRNNSHLAIAGSKAIDIAISANTMLVFRHDQLTYSYHPRGPSLALQSWLLTDIPLAQQNLKPAPLTGVKEPPPGENAQVMMLALGMPGFSDDADKFWHMFSCGVDANVVWPASRFELEPYYTSGPDYATTFKSYTCHGAFLAIHRVTNFDNDFFEMSEDETFQMGPGQRLIAEVGYECLYQSGHTRNTLSGENIGVFLGDSGMDWGKYDFVWSVAEHGRTNVSDLTCAVHNGVTVGRLSHIFGMRGPLQTVDTACSASLVALQAGHKALIENAGMANLSDAISAPHSILSGGQNVMLTPVSYCGMSAAGMVSHLGRCFTFDRTADGFERGEGVGLMFVKWSGELVDIEERFACLVATCSGHDGRSASLTAPNGPAQQDVIRRNMRMAGLDPSLISVCECHGTGTALGDPIEIGSLQGVMRGTRQFPLINTSAKTNISHLEPAAGCAGVMKCVLMVMHSCGPPNCHLRAVNPNLITAGYPVHFQQELCDTSFSTTFIGVSSFGFGGTNSRADLYGRCLCGAQNTGNVWTEERLQNRSLAYAQGLRSTFKGYDKLDKTVPGDSIAIMGSWDNFARVTYMRQKEPGCYVHRFELGSTRQACFRLCMSAAHRIQLHPAVDKASSTALICGPIWTSTGGKMMQHSPDMLPNWLIDGRNDAAHAGTRYCITFRWQGEKSISWEPEGDQEMEEFYICESSTCWEPRKMSCHSGEDGLYEAEIAISEEGVVRFYIQCADDAEQAIYPDGSGSACGPDKARKGRHFEVFGLNGQTMKVRLRVFDAHVSVAVFSGTGIRESWVSTAYYVTGSFNNWRKSQLHEDRFVKGLYKYHMVVLKDELVEYKIGIDAATTRSHGLQGLSAVFPEGGPKVLDAMRDFRGQVGSSWEIIVDLNQDDPERMIYHRRATNAEDNAVSM